MATITTTITAMTTTIEQLLRLQTWLSPAFPIGAFSYSHGLEYAVEAGLVRDRASAQEWIATGLLHGTGRSDGMLLAAAYRAGETDQAAEVAALAAAFRGTSELARESAAQGAAFLAAVRAVWPSDILDRWTARLGPSACHPRLEPGSSPDAGPSSAFRSPSPAEPLAGPRLKAGVTNKAIDPTLPVVVGAVCRFAGIELATALPLYLQSFAANLVSAAVRLVPLGHTNGLRIVAALEPVVTDAAEAAASTDLDDLGTATPMLDWCSMRHETQYTRLFRS